MADSLRMRARDVLRLWRKRVENIIPSLGDHFPHIYDPRHGVWETDGGWTEGFWTGILWWLSAYFGADGIERWARHYTRLLAELKADFSDHDLGFLFDHSCVLEHIVTGDTEMHPAALSAADRLSARFNPKGRFIRAHGDLTDPERAGYTIIDTVMNLRLLFWAHRLTGEKRYYDIGRAVAETIASQHIRSDGSTWQVVWFDPGTGKVVKKGTLQGYSAQSCWSRGQAWGIYGFTQVYKYSGDLFFKEQALRLTDYFTEHLPADGVVFYDFDDPSPAAKDTSAQAIAAAGLFALAELSTGSERAVLFERAVGLMSPLFSYVVRQEDPPTRGLLSGSCHFKSKAWGVNSEIVYGDYYLTEALIRYLSSTAW